MPAKMLTALASGYHRWLGHGLACRFGAAVARQLRFSRPRDPRRPGQVSAKLGAGRPLAALREARAGWLAYLAIPARRQEPQGSRARLTDRKDPEYNGAISPDGVRVIFAAITLSGTQGNLDIAAINVDGTGLKTISSDNGKLVHQDWPSWSPDGRRFAFSSTHEGNQEIYTAAADGTDLVRLTQSTGLDAHPCWSPDGRQIAFATDRWGGLELAAIRPDGTKLVRLTSSPGLDDYPAYSPDGRRLAFVSNRDGQFEIYVAAADGSGPVQPVATPITRHVPHLDAGRTWSHLHVEPRRCDRPLHANARAVGRPANRCGATACLIETNAVPELHDPVRPRPQVITGFIRRSTMRMAIVFALAIFLADVRSFAGDSALASGGFHRLVTLGMKSPPTDANEHPVAEDADVNVRLGRTAEVGLDIDIILVFPSLGRSAAAGQGDRIAGPGRFQSDDQAIQEMKKTSGVFNFVHRGILN